MTAPSWTHDRETAGATDVEGLLLRYLQLMLSRFFLTLLITGSVALAAPGPAAQEPVNLIDQVYGKTPVRPQGYAFSKVVHYDIVQRVETGAGLEKKVIEGTMDLYYNPEGQSYGRVVDTEEARLVNIGDLELGMRYSLTELGELRLGSESKLSDTMRDTLPMSRVSGDREIDGRMSAHYWHESGTRIDELWADSQASQEEVNIGRLWPRFEPGFASLAIGSYEGLATRWVSIDTQFSRDPRVILEFKGTEELAEPVGISFEGFVFPVSPADEMRKRLEAERGGGQR